MAGKFAEWADEVNIYIIYSIYEENKLPDFMAPSTGASVSNISLCVDCMFEWLRRVRRFGQFR